MALAIGLRSQPISKGAFRTKISEVKVELKKAMEAPAEHLAIRHIQDIFTEHEARRFSLTGF